MDETSYDRWIQCSSCNKWRKIPDESVMKVADTPWRCSLNVFSAQYNRCEAPQEEMPEEATDDDDDVVLTPQNVIAALGLEITSDGRDDLFSLSDCQCVTCREMNAAVRDWKKMTASGHAMPLVQCVLRSITATTSIAEQLEADKRFVWCPDNVAVPSADSKR